MERWYNFQYMKRLVIIDGKSVFYRGYYAMGGLSLPDGTPTGGVYGFAAMLLEILGKLKPDYVAVAWDKSKTNIRSRRAIYPEYKANRKPPPEDFYAQVPLLMELLAAFHIPLYECDDFEADDIMGSLSRKAEAVGVRVDLVSSDLDMLQIVDHDTDMYQLKRGFSEVVKFDVAAVEKKYGLKQAQFLDWKSLKGDSSDNIPGVPGIGEKGAVKLLQEYGDLDGIYAHADEVLGSVGEKLRAGKELAYISRQLAEIMFDAPVEFEPEETDVGRMDKAEVMEILSKFRFRSLVRKFEKLEVGGEKKQSRGSDEDGAGEEKKREQSSGENGAGTGPSLRAVAMSSLSLSLQMTKSLQNYILNSLTTERVLYGDVRNRSFVV